MDDAAKRIQHLDAKPTPAMTKVINIFTEFAKLKHSTDTRKPSKDRSP